MVHIKAELCVVCKASRLLCGLEKCPKLDMLDSKISVEQKVGKEFFGPSPSVFVGKLGWPNVYVGPLGAVTEDKEVAKTMENPSSWFGRDYGDIIRMRSSMVRGKQRENVYSTARVVSDVQELAMASEPTDTEIVFRKKPSMRMSFSEVSQPMGPSGLLERFRVTENVHIEKGVEKVVEDDLKAADASRALYSAGQDVYKITTLFSAGLLGMEGRRLVPTRWSITATDDIVFKSIACEIREFQELSQYLVFHSSFLDNSFTVLLMPGDWEYEGFEAWAPGSVWSSDIVVDDLGARVVSKSSQPHIIEEYEKFEGRTNYADRQGGGYYAARLGVAEKLRSLRRQAKAIVFREVYEGYTVPMGVWVVRETVRHAMNNLIGKFDTKEEALAEVSERLRIPISDYIKQSKILSQKRLLEFLKP